MKGPKGELERDAAPGHEGDVEDGTSLVERPIGRGPAQGAARPHATLVANMVEGVTKGFKKQLEIIGVGYKAEVRPYRAAARARLLAPGRVSRAGGHQAHRAAADAVVIEGANKENGRSGRGGDSQPAASRSRTRGRASSIRASRSAARPARREASNAEDSQAEDSREELRTRRHFRVRQEGRSGTRSVRVWWCIRSLKHIYAQLVDDATQRTLMTVTDQGLEGKKARESAEVGKRIAAEGEGGRRHARRLRPRWIQISRPRESGGRRRPRRRVGVLTWQRTRAESGGDAAGGESSTGGGGGGGGGARR